MLKRLTSIMPLFGGALFAGGGRLPLAVTGLVAALVVAGLVALSLNSPTEASEGPEEESASLDIHFDSVPTGWSVMSGTASTVGAASAHWTKQRMIRYSLSGHSAFSIKKMKGTVAYDGSEIDAASVSLTINARHRTGAVEGASITVSVTVNQPVLLVPAEGERLTRQDPQPETSPSTLTPGQAEGVSFTQNAPEGTPICTHDGVKDKTCIPQASPGLATDGWRWEWHGNLQMWVKTANRSSTIEERGTADCGHHDHVTSFGKTVRHNDCGTNWTSTLTVDENAGYYGCDNVDGNQANCSRVLSNDVIGGIGSVRKLYWHKNFNKLWLEILHVTNPKDRLRGATLTVNGVDLRIDDAGTQGSFLTFPYDPTPDWVDGDVISIRLRSASLGPWDATHDFNHLAGVYVVKAGCVQGWMAGTGDYKICTVTDTWAGHERKFPIVYQYQENQIKQQYRGHQQHLKTCHATHYNDKAAFKRCADGSLH